MAALVAQDPSRVTGRNRALHGKQCGDDDRGRLMGHGHREKPEPQYVTDPSTGNVAWYGSMEEHGQPAYYAMRLKVDDGKTSQVEAVIQRKGGAGPYRRSFKYTHDPAFSEILPREQRVSRSTLISLVDGYFSTLQRNDGTLHTKFDPDCARQENGMTTTNGTFATTAQGCEAQFKLGTFRFDDKVRGRRFATVDEERGVVVATGYIDHPRGSRLPDHGRQDPTQSLQIPQFAAAHGDVQDPRRQDLPGRGGFHDRALRHDIGMDPS